MDSWRWIVRGNSFLSFYILNNYLIKWNKQEYSQKKSIINCRLSSTTNIRIHNTPAGANTGSVSCCCWYNCVTCKADTGNQASRSANVLIQSANQLIGTSSNVQQDSSSSVCLLTLQPLTCDHLPRLFPVKSGSEGEAGQVWFSPCSFFIINLILWQRYNGTWSFALSYQTSTMGEVAELANRKGGCICVHQ